jgi:quinol monooxygenase YgiN
MIIQYAVIPVDPEQRDAAIEAATELARTTREEESGVIDYRVAADVEDGNVLRIVEQYEDRAAVDAHMGSEHFEAFQGELPEFVDGDVELHLFEVSEHEQLM